jgi:DNA-binding response OmpR family regulator
MRKERILTIDDDPDILDVLSLTLSEHYDIVQAPNGQGQRPRRH